MANSDHQNILKQGNEVWNEWREENHEIIPDLSHSNLDEFKLDKFNLGNCNLSGASLRRTSFRVTNLSGANLDDTDIYYTDFFLANLFQASLQNSKIIGAQLLSSDAREADFTNTQMRYVTFSDTLLNNARFTGSKISLSNFSNINLKDVRGLEEVTYEGPCTIGIDTLYKSAGKIPAAFLLGCGVPDYFIKQLPSLTETKNVVKYYSCFISYSTKDESFAKRLYSKMREAHLRVWFAPEDIKGGQKIFDQIDSAIQMNDKLLLLVSEHSMYSEWVLTEVRRALETEKREGRRKLFPIRLVGLDAIKEWRLIDSNSGKDLAEEIRGYFIPDFSEWQNDEIFETGFDSLLMYLRVEEYLSLNAPLKTEMISEFVNDKCHNLTDREIDFVKLLCTDLTYKEIADVMYISPRSLEGYREALFVKLRVKSRVGAVRYAFENKIL